MSQSVEQDNAGTPVNIISDFDPESGWNNATKEYTIPVDGYYSISFSGINFYTEGYVPQLAPGGFLLSQSGATILVTEVSSLPGKDMPVANTLVVRAVAGDKIKLVSSTCVCPGPQTWTMKKAALTISRLVNY